MSKAATSIRGVADVVVCDGFIGNVALKVSEGLVEMIARHAAGIAAGDGARKIGCMLSREAYRDFKKRVDYSEYGGAPLLGREGREHHLPRAVQCECDQERDPRGGGIRAGPRQ